MGPSLRPAIAILALSAPALLPACAPGATPPPAITATTLPLPPASSSAAAPVACPDGMVGVPSPASPTAAQPSAAFCIDATEVTAADYAACMKAGTCPPRNEACTQGLPSDEGTFPARCMTWNDASAYCASKGKRLPTEPEWVLAACGTDGRTYPWGNEKPTSQVCWMGEPGGSRGTTNRGPCRVGSFPAGRSPYGMLDAAGNVGEFTSTPVSRADHAVHGGGFNESWAWMGCGNRMSDSSSSDNRGFRCAASPR